jgi:hypothetical protein
VKVLYITMMRLVLFYVLVYVTLIAYCTPDIQIENLVGYNMSSVEEDCIKCVGNNSRKLFIKELWFAGASSPIYNCRSSPHLVSRFAVITERACEVVECAGIDTRLPTRIYQRERIHCVKLFPMDVLENDAILLHYNLTIARENISQSPSFAFHYLLEVVEIIMCMILCAIIIKVRREYLGIHTPSIHPSDSVSYYVADGHI